MSDAHTKGPIKLARHGAIVGGPMQHFVNGSSQPQVFLACVGPEGGTDEQSANARRLVACWNACEGLSTENLEQNKKLREMVLDYNSALRDHHKLLEALNGLVAVIDSAGLLNLSQGVQLGPTVWYVKANDAMDAARAAIKPVET